MLEAMPCGCIAFDDYGNIESVNEFLYNLLEYDPNELIDKNIEYILTISSRIFYQTQLYPLIRLKGKVDEIFLSLKSKRGTHIPVMLYCKRNVSDDKISNICVFVTVWEREKHELEMLKANEMRQQTLLENETLNKLKEELELHQQQLDQQVSILTQRNQEYIQLNKVLTHDLQEPIRKISIFTDRIVNHIKSINDPEVLNNFQKIQASVLQLRNLTSSLQKFVYTYTSEEKTSISFIKDLIEEAQSDAIIETGFDDFELKTGEIPTFEGNIVEIKLVFMEILKNSIQNRNINKRLKIEIRAVLIEENSYLVSKGKYRYTDHIKLEISDNGNGFDSQYNSYIFGLFNKLNPLSEGAGLGLALCKQIISNHYGTITINSEIEKGTTVTIILPVQQPVTN